MRTRVLLIANNGMYLTHSGDYFVLAPTVNETSVFWKEGNVIYDQLGRMIVFNEGKYLVEVYNEQNIQDDGLRRPYFLFTGASITLIALILLFYVFWTDSIDSQSIYYTTGIGLGFLFLAIGITLMILSV